MSKKNKKFVKIVQYDNEKQEREGNILVKLEAITGFGLLPFAAYEIFRYQNCTLLSLYLIWFILLAIGVLIVMLRSREVFYIEEKVIKDETKKRN